MMLINMLIVYVNGDVNGYVNGYVNVNTLM